MNNIENIIKDGLCTGCGTCAGLCPHDIITMKIDYRKGLYVPNLLGICNDCGICVEVCPGHEVDFINLNKDIFGKQPDDLILGNYLDCCIGNSSNNHIRTNSSSGGVVSEILIFALENKIIDGALVTKMKKDDPLKPEPFIAKTKEEIIEASCDKYCPVPVNIGLKKILEAKEDKKFAVVGLPCHIHGIRKAEYLNETLKEKIILHIGLFCAYGVNFLATNYVLKERNIKKDTIEEIHYRKGNFPPGNALIKCNNNCINQISHKKFWSLTFSFFTWFSPIRCTLCCDQTSELADISVGGPRFPYLVYGNYNQSPIIIRNEFGEKILENAIHNQTVELKNISEKDMSKLKEMQSYKKNQILASGNLLKLFRKKNPKYSINGLVDPSIKTYIDALFLYIRTHISESPRILNIINFIHFRRNFEK